MPLLAALAHVPCHFQMIYRQSATSASNWMTDYIWHFTTVASDRWLAQLVKNVIMPCRHLDRKEFKVFLQRYCLLSDTKLSEIADDMIHKLSQPDRQADAPSDADFQLQLQALSNQQVCYT